MLSDAVVVGTWMLLGQKSFVLPFTKDMEFIYATEMLINHFRSFHLKSSFVVEHLWNLVQTFHSLKSESEGQMCFECIIHFQMRCSRPSFGGTKFDKVTPKER